MTDDRRRHRRFGLELPAAVRFVGHAATDAITARLADMSEGGALLTVAAAAIDAASGQRVLLGAPVYVRFTLEAQICEATGEVTRVMPYGDGVGVGVSFAVTSESLVFFLRNLSAVREALRPTLLGDIRDLELVFGAP